MLDEEINANRNYKDSVFTALFSEPQATLDTAEDVHVYGQGVREND